MNRDVRDLSRLIPPPEVLSFGGRPCRAWPARLIELREIQRWLARGVSHPLDGIDPARKATLRLACDAAEAWPPDVYGVDGQAALMGTPEGRSFIATLALRSLKPAAVAKRASSATATEWSTLARVFWGPTPIEEIMHLA